jgi:hypothetical protein
MIRHNNRKTVVSRRSALTQHAPTKLALRSVALALAVALPVALSAQVPAGANETGAVSVDTAAIEQQMTAFEGRYASMTAAMATYYAANRGQALGAFLGDNPAALANFAGGGDGLSNLLNKASQVKSPEELNRLLATAGVGLDVNSWNTLAAARSDLQAKAGSMDAAVVNAGMSWASALTQIAVPSVQAPGIPAMNTTLATSMPAEGLAFGLFLNQSLANLIGNFPDVFAQVSASGVASPTAAAAWQSAMNAAANSSSSDLGKIVGTSACGAAFVDGLTGKSANGCSPCAIAGMYGNAQVGLLFNPAAGSKAIDPSNPAVTATEWANLTPAQRAAIVAQNPGLAQNVDNALNGTNGCSSASGAVKSGASDSVKKVIDFLERP